LNIIGILEKKLKHYSINENEIIESERQLNYKVSKINDDYSKTVIDKDTINKKYIN